MEEPGESWKKQEEPRGAKRRREKPGGALKILEEAFRILGDALRSLRETWEAQSTPKEPLGLLRRSRSREALRMA